jgi:peroxiredoxin
MKPWLSNIRTKLLLTFLVFSLAENVVLLYQRRQLAVSLARSTPRPVIDPELEVGDSIPEFEAIDPGGVTRNIRLSADKLLFVYSASCPYCDKNFDNWKEIERQVGREKVLYLSIDSVDAARKDAVARGISDEVWILASFQDRNKLKVSHIPQTIFVSNGIVKVIQVGVLSSERTQVFRSIHKES